MISYFPYVQDLCWEDTPEPQLLVHWVHADHSPQTGLVLGSSCTGNPFTLTVDATSNIRHNIVVLQGTKEHYFSSSRQNSKWRLLTSFFSPLSSERCSLLEKQDLVHFVLCFFSSEWAVLYPETALHEIRPLACSLGPRVQIGYQGTGMQLAS